MPNTGSGTGWGGKTYEERQLASRVRNKLLADIYELLSESKTAAKFGERKYTLILRMAPNSLPRLNEHTGEGGSPLFLPSEIINKHVLESKTGSADLDSGSEGDSQGSASVPDS